MSTFHSTIDALLSWKEMNVSVCDSEPLSKESSERMKAIGNYLNSQGMAVNLAQTMMALWSAMENEDSPPSNDEMRGSLVQCSEAAWLIARVAGVEDAISYRLRQADLHEAQHGDRHHEA